MGMGLQTSNVLINHLTTDDECAQHATLDACYRLAQLVFKTGFAPAKNAGMVELGGFSHDMLCTSWLTWLTIEGHWLGHFSTNGIKMYLCSCRGSICGTLNHLLV